MQLRTFITAAGTAAAVALATQVFAQAAGGKEKESYGTRRTECEWSATTTHGVDTIRLAVKGVCQEPTPGYKLALTHPKAGISP